MHSKWATLDGKREEETRQRTVPRPLCQRRGWGSSHTLRASPGLRDHLEGWGGVGGRLNTLPTFSPHRLDGTQLLPERKES